MGQRVLVHLYRALKQACLMQTVSHFRFAYGRDSAPKEIRLLEVSAGCPYFGEFGISPHAVARPLLTIRRVDGNCFPGCRLRFLEFAMGPEPMRFPDQWALFEWVAEKKLI